MPSTILPKTWPSYLELSISLHTAFFPFFKEQGTRRYQWDAYQRNRKLGQCELRT
jgi:hypothetical protein